MSTTHKIALFGLEIVHAAWMKVYATLARVSEDDEELYNQARAVDASLAKLESTLRQRLRGK